MVQVASYPPLQKTQGRGTHSSETGWENTESRATRPFREEKLRNACSDLGNCEHQANVKAITVTSPVATTVMGLWDLVVLVLHLSFAPTIYRLGGGKGLFSRSKPSLLVRLALAPTLIPCVLLAVLSSTASLVCLSCFAVLYGMLSVAVWQGALWGLILELVLCLLNVFLLLAGSTRRLLRLNEVALGPRLLFPGFSVAYGLIAVVAWRLSSG